MVLEGERVKNRLPARTQLTYCLKATVESGVVETALACKHFAVLDGEQASLQHGFRLDLAGGKTVYGLVVHDAHQQDGTLLELRCQNLVHVAAGLFREVLDGGFRNHATMPLSCPKLSVNAFRLPLSSTMMLSTVP